MAPLNVSTACGVSEVANSILALIIEYRVLGSSGNLEIIHDQFRDIMLFDQDAHHDAESVIIVFFRFIEILPGIGGWGNLSIHCDEPLTWDRIVESSGKCTGHWGLIQWRKKLSMYRR